MYHSGTLGTLGKELHFFLVSVDLEFLKNIQNQEKRLEVQMVQETAISERMFWFHA